MTIMNLTVPDEMKAFIETQVARNGHASVSDYLQTLIREDQKRRAKRELEAKFREATASGLATPMTHNDWIHLRQQAVATMPDETIQP